MDQNVPRRYTDKELGLSSRWPPTWAIAVFLVVCAIVAVPAFEAGFHLGRLIR